jgi:suppressor of ftsI
MMGVYVGMVDTLGVVDVAATAASPDYAEAFGRLREHERVIGDVARYRRHFTRAPDYDLELRMDKGTIPFQITQLMRLDSLFFNPVEWAGTMPMMDWLPTTRDMRWVLRDARTGAENNNIAWQFRVGDFVRIRIRNERHGLHAMQHPIHFHGQRFLVISANGVPVRNHVWKDTILVPVGTSTEILLEATNPGRWMAHCHIAEHLEAGMQMVFTVR